MTSKNWQSTIYCVSANWAFVVQNSVTVSVRTTLFWKNRTSTHKTPIDTANPDVCFTTFCAIIYSQGYTMITIQTLLENRKYYFGITGACYVSALNTDRYVFTSFRRLSGMPWLYWWPRHFMETWKNMQWLVACLSSKYTLNSLKILLYMVS